MKTHCPQFHPYTEDNTYVNPKGSPVCRLCKRSRGREEARVKNNTVAKTCPQCWSRFGISLKKYCHECVPSGTEGIVFANRIRNYGVDKTMFDAMYFEQNGTCSLCPEEATEVDHNHTTGLVRELLCASCNMRLGQIENNPEWLTKAFDYVTQNG